MIGETFVHYGVPRVTWRIERITPEWVYCLPVSGKLPKSLVKHQKPDGTLEWCHAAVEKQLKRKRSKP